MSKRGWHLGWAQYPWAIPISEVLEQERIEAQATAADQRRLRDEAAQAARDQAKAEALEAHRQELQMLKGARGDVLACLVIAGELVPAMRSLAGVISAAAKPGPNGEPPALSPKECMNLLTRHTQMVQRAVGAAEAVIQLSRLERGATTMNVGIGEQPLDHIPDDEVTEEEMLAELAAIQGVLANAARRGQLAASNVGPLAAPKGQLTPKRARMPRPTDD